MTPENWSLTDMGGYAARQHRNEQQLEVNKLSTKDKALQSSSLNPPESGQMQATSSRTTVEGSCYSVSQGLAKKTRNSQYVSSVGEFQMSADLIRYHQANETMKTVYVIYRHGYKKHHVYLLHKQQQQIRRAKSKKESFKALKTNQSIERLC